MKKKIMSLINLIAILVGIFSFSPVATKVQAASNEQTIYDFLINNMGLNTAAACGVLANIEKESNFRNDVIEGGYTWESGGGYGICQWTNYPRTSGSGRRTNLVTWCNSNGYNYKSLEGQLYFLKHELETDVRRGVYAFLQQVDNSAEGAYEAGYKWCYTFEAPAGYDTGVSVTRGNYARDKYWPKYNIDPIIDFQKDTSYPTPFKAYPANSSDTTELYNSSLVVYDKSKRNIAPNDLCTVSDVYTNGYCRVTYPTKNGENTEYAKISAFITNMVSKYHYTPPTTLNTYTNSNFTTTFGEIYTTDDCIVVGAIGNKLELIYPVQSGYKLGWIEKPLSSDFPTPLYSYNASSSDMTMVYKELSTLGGEVYGKIFVDDKCTLNSVNLSGGWINVTYPAGNSTKTGYVYIDQFIPSDSRLSVFYKAKVSQQTDTFRKRDMSVKYGYVSVSDEMTIVGKSGNKFQVLYPLDTGGYKLGWIYDTNIVKDLKEIYIVSNPSKTTYLEGENFNSSGLAVNAKYSDNSTANVTSSCSLSGYSSSPGIKTITVSYNGRSAVFNVTVNQKSLSGISIISNPSKTVYDVGEAIDTNGLKVKAAFNNGTSDENCDYTVESSGVTNSLGSKSVKVNYTYGSITKSAYFNITVSHNFGEWTTTQQAMCGVGGIQTRQCKGCGYTETRTVTAKEHEYVSEVHSPTCTEQGYTLHTCKNCAYSYKDNYTNALGHNYTSTVKSPTCLEQGFTTHVCTRCNHIYKDNYTGALGHNYTSTVKSPTCLEQGFTTHICTRCNDTYKDNYTGVLGHSYNSTVIAPTETEQGYTLHICSVCGDSYKSDYTDTLPPKPSVIAGDINGDGKVNMKDLTRLHQYINNWNVEVQTETIDVNGDGKVNMKDLTRLHQYINGWNVSVYVGNTPVSTKVTAQKQVYGTSELGRELVCYDFKPDGYTSTVLLNFAIHGYEDEYSADAQVLVNAAENLIAYYNNNYPENCKTRLIIIPCANPDGLYDGTTNNGFGRCNANGVDLNRDFDANYRSYSSARNYTQYPFSAAESRALRDLYTSVKPSTVIDFHGWENCTIGNYELAQIFEEEMGLAHKVSFMTNNASGYFSNWAYQQGSYSLLVEFTNSNSVDGNKLLNSVNRLITGEYEVSHVDANYQKFNTITCYALSTGHEKTYQYFNKPYSTESYIAGQTDEVVILRIYENGWVNAQYPITNGYKAAFCTLDKFISPSEQVSMYKLDISGNTTVYKRKDLSESFGKVYPTDEIYVVAQTDNALQIIYTLDAGGWKMGWIPK